MKKQTIKPCCEFKTPIAPTFISGGIVSTGAEIPGFLADKLLGIGGDVSTTIKATPVNFLLNGFSFTQYDIVKELYQKNDPKKEDPNWKLGLKIGATTAIIQSLLTVPIDSFTKKERKEDGSVKKSGMVEDFIDNWVSSVPPSAFFAAFAEEMGPKFAAFGNARKFSPNEKICLNFALGASSALFSNYCSKPFEFAKQKVLGKSDESCLDFLKKQFKPSLAGAVRAGAMMACFGPTFAKVKTLL
eukprot:Anaeramoba_ignava/a349977_134.p1 GENE.a349977_134~~a349977_134.p1  ORF type:complete len:244 (+),score=75.92 a349977_134:202-933(+)